MEQRGFFYLSIAAGSQYWGPALRTFPQPFIDLNWNISFVTNGTDGDISYACTVLGLTHLSGGSAKTVSTFRVVGAKVGGTAGISTTSEFGFVAWGKWK